MPYCHIRASPLVRGVRWKFFTSASSAARSAESQAGGGGSRSWSGDDRTQVFQVDSATPPGFVPVQSPAPGGTVPVHCASERIEVVGHGRSWAYFESQAATVAS